MSWSAYPSRQASARAARLALAALAAAALLGGCTRSAQSEAPVLVRGRQVYEAHCAACHGARLEGQPDWRTRRDDGRLPAPPHDASGHTWHHADPVLFEITKHGVQRFAGADYASDMPAFAGRLTDDEIRAVIAYIKSTWPPKVQRQQAELK